MSSELLPFSAVVGQDQAKLALVLAACERRIGGVLLRGDKGSAKTTLARGLAALLPGEAPFVELPVGATEDRVVGTLDLAAALTGGEKRFDPGLLHAADGGVLYVDEINLLPDHLVDVLLDVAATGVNRIEREGVSHRHPSRFLLVGSMNPEEGDLRPQLLDRFGLAVDVRTPSEPGERRAALSRRLEFDADPEGVRFAYGPADAEVARRLAAFRPAPVPGEILDAVAALCASVGAEGLRADLTICRAASALAGWEGRPVVGGDDVRRVAPLALAHRARRDPLDPSRIDESRMRDALDEALGDGDRRAGPPDPPAGAGQGGEAGGQEADGGPGSDRPSGGGEPGDAGQGPGRPGGTATERVAGVAGGASTIVLPSAGTAGSGPRPVPGRGRGPTEQADTGRGRVGGDDAPAGSLRSVALGATVRRAAGRRAADPGSPPVEAGDVRQAVREERTASLVVLAVDASGSMGAETRMELAKGAVMGLLRDAYQRRDRVALVTFRGEQADVLLRPTASVEVARSRLVELPTGGRTPLGAGLRRALAVARAGEREGFRPVLVVITDGRATASSGGGDAMEEADTAAAEVRRTRYGVVVVDVEAASGVPLGLGARLADRMGALLVPLDPGRADDGADVAGWVRAVESAVAAVRSGGGR